MSGKPVSEAATYTTQNKHKGRRAMPSAGFEPPDPSNQAVADPRLRAHGHRIQYRKYLPANNYLGNWVNCYICPFFINR